MIDSACSNPARVRRAEPTDVPAIVDLVHALAVYEREPDAATATEADFAEALFPQDPGGARTAYGHVAEVDGQVVGIAIWYLTFSTWTGKPGIWLEDLFVLPDHRGVGLGRELLATLARLCVERGYPRLEWYVLDWNTPSIGFYRGLGAEALDDWTTFRLDGPTLSDLGASARR